jgi:hypothetical protein
MKVVNETETICEIISMNWKRKNLSMTYLSIYDTYVFYKKEKLPDRSSKLIVRHGKSTVLWDKPNMLYEKENPIRLSQHTVSERKGICEMRN